MPRLDRNIVPRKYDDYFPDELERSVIVTKDGNPFVAYCPQDHQVPFHASEAPNLLALGTRGTGKSKQLRWDAILRCLMFPNFHALILRRTLKQLRESHLHFIAAEMALLGGEFLWTTFEAKFPNGSILQFTHCETLNDVMNFLSSEWGFIGFDELSTFTQDMFLQIGAAARAPVDAPYKAVIRAGTNPLGIGAPWLKAWFVDHDVDLTEFPDYDPADYEMQFQSLDQNKYLDRREYTKRLQNLPEHIRKAWLYGEFVIEGAYFTEFNQRRMLDPTPVYPEGRMVEWHVIEAMPLYQGKRILDQEWISIYRCVDWGYDPDPAVCLWIAVIPGGHSIVFKERHWKRTLAKDVAADIKKLSKGMRVVDTFVDPTMMIKTGAAKYSIGEIFEQNGVPITAAQNDRELFGLAVHDYLGTTLTVEENEEIRPFPKLQIVRSAAPDLIRTFPLQQMDPTDPRKLANGNDHWVVALAYFCMGNAQPSQAPHASTTKAWMQPKRRPKMVHAGL